MDICGCPRNAIEYSPKMLKITLTMSLPRGSDGQFIILFILCVFEPQCLPHHTHTTHRHTPTYTVTYIHTPHIPLQPHSIHTPKHNIQLEPDPKSSYVTFTNYRRSLIPNTQHSTQQPKNN